MEGENHGVALLVVNADDYGLCPSVDLAIDECIAAGVVTSMSVLIWRDGPLTVRPGISGVHLRLDDGPLLTCKSPAAEWNAQIDKFLTAGHPPTHFDSHHHVHFNNFVTYANLCQQHNAVGLGMNDADTKELRKIGVLTPDLFYRGKVGLEFPEFRHMFDRYETVWLMVHPGYNQEDLRAKSSMDSERERQLEFLLSKAFLDWVTANGIILIKANEL